MLHQDKKVELTKNELGILRLLIINKGSIMLRDALIDELWQDESFIDENTFRYACIWPKIRSKLYAIIL